MGQFRVIALSAGLCLIMAASGCGGSSKSSSARGAQPRSVPTAPPPPTSSNSPLLRHVLRNRELAGMNPALPLRVVSSAASWASGENLGPAALKAEVGRLRRLGFKDALAENLTTSGNPNRFGLSSVEQFGTPKAAEAELKYSTGPHSLGAPWSFFRVEGIPGARGFEQGGNGGGGRNIAFAVGPYYYVVGVGWQGSATNAVSTAKLKAAAQLLYRRVHAAG